MCLGRFFRRSTIAKADIGPAKQAASDQPISHKLSGLQDFPAVSTHLANKYNAEYCYPRAIHAIARALPATRG
jgi:hypothetical protein